jgi:hypothetical protein
VTRKWLHLAVAIALTASINGCGGGSGLESGGGSGLESDDPHEVVDAWAQISCGDNKVSAHYGSDAEKASQVADLDASAQCVREDLDGTFQQKRQLIFVFNSKSAMATYLSARPCPAELGYLRVNGDAWTATTYVQDLATDLVDRGGKLCD